MIDNPKLPWTQNYLEPFFSERLIHYHFKRHRNYVKTVNEYISKFPDDEILSQSSLYDLVVEFEPFDLESEKMLHSASQALNHEFYWNCLKKDVKMSNTLKSALEERFTTIDEFKKSFMKMAKSVVGSGWVWLVVDSDGLKIVKTKNTTSPHRYGYTPLLTCDLWEHAWEADPKFTDKRDAYLETFWNNINWSFVEDNLQNSNWITLNI